MCERQRIFMVFLRRILQKADKRVFLAKNAKKVLNRVVLHKNAVFSAFCVVFMVR